MLFGNTADDICIAECALQEFIPPQRKKWITGWQISFWSMDKSADSNFWKGERSIYPI